MRKWIWGEEGRGMWQVGERRIGACGKCTSECVYVGLLNAREGGRRREIFYACSVRMRQRPLQSRESPDT